MMRKILILATLVVLAGCDQPKDRTGEAAPAPTAPTGPVDPTWAAGLRGQALSSAFSTTTNCLGFVDGPQPPTPQGVSVIGWSWMKDLKTGAPQIVLTDAAGNMVAFGAGGTPRPDVPAGVPEITRPDVGWSVPAPTTPGAYGVYGVDVASKTACRLGEARL